MNKLEDPTTTESKGPISNLQEDYSVVNRTETEPSKTLLCAFITAFVLLYTAGLIAFLDLRATSLNTVGFSWFQQRGSNYRLHDAQRYEPQQLHLSLGIDESQIIVTWATMEPPADCYLFYAKLTGDSFEREKKLPATLKTAMIKADANWTRVANQEGRILYSWRSIIPDLEAGEIYVYRVGSEVKRGHQTVTYYSKTYKFTAKSLANSAGCVSICIYGDLGLINGKSTGRLIQDVDHDKYDVIIHNGDFAYDLDTHLGDYGDQFMRKIEPIAARVPYQTSVGNHEAKDNFTHYDVRFNMINSGSVDKGQWNNFYYSFNVGPVHFISISTEFYYFLTQSGIGPLEYQWQWLEKDLIHATSEEQRAKRPWIIVFGHRPMYCSSADGDDCSKDSNLLRKGLPGLGTYALEKLFYDYGVDVELYAHEHQYERFLPIYDGKVYNGTDDSSRPYLNPRAPVHIITGSAGCQERLDPFKGTPVVGSVKRISDYGYTRLTAAHCELRFEQISDDLVTVVDSFIIRKTRQNFPESMNNIDCNLHEDLKPYRNTKLTDYLRSALRFLRLS